MKTIAACLLLGAAWVMCNDFEDKLLPLQDTGKITRKMEAFYRRPCAYVPYVPGGIMLDGRMDDPAWRKADPLALRFLDGTDASPTQKTEVRVVSDERYLYVGFLCMESDMEGACFFARERDGALWRDDSVEVFLDVENRGKWPRYFYFGTNIPGVVTDARWRDSSWDGGVRVKTHRGPDRWSAEFAIPFADLLAGKGTAGGVVWGANFTRARQARTPERGERRRDFFFEDTAWSPTGGWDTHEPKKFGRLFLEVLRLARRGKVTLDLDRRKVRYPDPRSARPAPTDIVRAVEKKYGGPAVFVPRIDRVPAVDGVLDETAWKLAPAVGFRFMSGSSVPPTQKTIARLLCDEKNLYVAVECFEEDTAGIKAAVARHDGPVWQDDGVEIFLEPAHRHSFKYFQIAVNARGVTFECRNRRDEKWNPRMKVKTRVEKDRWVVEMAIPFSELGLRGGIPALWGANFTRVRQPRPGAAGEETAWSPTEAATSHVPSKFGHIYLETGTVYPDLGDTADVGLTGGNTRLPSLQDVNPDVLSATERKRMQVNRMTMEHLRSVSERLWRRNDARLRAVKSREEWNALKRKIRAAFWKSIGGKPRQKCPLDVRITGRIRGKGWEILNLVYQSRPGLWVTANLYRPTGRTGPFPAVLRLIGHSSAGKRSAARMHVELARKGYVTLALDSLGQGERMLCGRGFGEATPTSNHYILGGRAFLVHENLAGYMVWDAVRGIDYLLGLPEVDPKRIAVTGSSGGGTLSIYVGALDERVSVVVPVSAGGSPRFGSNYDAEQNLLARYRDGFDCQALFALCAPRPLRVIREVTGPLDTPEPAAEAARRIYALYDAADRIEYRKTHFPHGYGPGHQRPAIEWLDRWFGVDPADVRGEPGSVKGSDLLCTRTGMLFYTREFPERETPVSLQRKRARRRLKFPERPRGKKEVAEAARRVTEKLRSLLCLQDVSFDDVHVKKPVRIREGTMEKVYFTTDPGVVVTCLILKPRMRREKYRPIVWIYERDRASLVRRRYAEIVRLLEAGRMICIPNVRGTGETAPESSYTFYNAETAQNCGGFEIGMPLIGFRVKDVLCTIDYICSRPDVDATGLCLVGDSLAPVNPLHIPCKRQVTTPGPGRIHQGESLGPCLAVLAAALDPRVRSTVVNGILYSYLSLFDDLYFYHQNNLWIPGILRFFDLADECALVAPRPLLVLNPVDGLNRAASPKDIQKEYARARGAYRARGETGNFVLTRDAAPGERMVERLSSLPR